MSETVGLLSGNSQSGDSHKSHGHSCGDKSCGEGKTGPNSKAHPIFEAIKHGILIPVQTYIEQEGVEVLRVRDEKGHTPAHWACLGGHTTILRHIIENKGPIDEPSENELGAHPIHWACVNGHIAIVDILTQAGVSLDVTDNKGCSSLLVSAQYGQTMLAGYLMGKGARLQLVDKDGDNALHWAAFKGYSELMRLLIYSGFNPRQKDNFGQTPLHLACINGNLTAVKELCEQDGVEIDLADKNNKTPLMLALGRKHESIVQYLKKEARFRTSILPRIDIWSILFGPPGNTKGALLFFIISVLCWGYPMYIIKCLSVTFYDLQVIHLLFITSNVFMWISLYHASTTDPGFLPRNIPEYDQAIKQVAHFDEWKQGINPLSQLCHTCRTVKPVRAKHCRICNRCIKEFDHHCPYIYNCVGYKNRVWFCIFIFALFLATIATDYLCYYRLFVIGWDWIVFIGFLEAAFFSIGIIIVFLMTVSITDGISFVIFVINVAINGLISIYFGFVIIELENGNYRYDYIFGLFLLFIYELIAFYIACFTVVHAGLNLTTNERINRLRYKYLKDGKGNYYNPFDRGVKNNILEYLHLKKPLRDQEIEYLSVDIV